MNMTEAELKEEIKFYQNTLGKIADLIGVNSPWTLIALSREGESYADVLIRHLKIALNKHSESGL